MAQPNMFGVTEFDQDPETAAELMRLKRKQSIADAMMQSGRVTPQGRMAGRVYVGPSIFEGLGGLAEQYVAKGQMGEAEQGYKALADKKKAVADAEFAKIQDVVMGRPDGQQMYAAGNNPDEQSGMGFQAGTPAGTRDQIMQTMLASKLPDYKKAGLQMMVSGGEKKEAREAAFEQRKFELEENHKNRMTQLQIAKASDAEKAREQRAHQEQMIRLTAGLRQPAAPTMTEVVDPKDPKRLLRVDAKAYRGGSLGEAGVLGISGKEPTFAAKENKVESGKTQLAETLDQVQASYDALHQLGGLPSQERGTLSNIASSIASSGVGQMAGRAGSTKEQVERDVIKASRLNVLNALKQATGKSAQELNSNVELKTNLDALSDPTQGYEAATRILDNIRKTYLDGKSPTSGKIGGKSDVRSEADKILGL